MRQIWQRIKKDIKAYWQLGAVLVLYIVLARLLFDQFCPMVIVTGIPCPGCGMTRSVFFFLTGQWERGAAMNPLGILWIGLAAYFCLMRYVLGKKPKGVLTVGGVLTVLMVFFYLYRMYCFFPGEAPVSFYEGNLIGRFWPGYEELVMRIAGAGG